ncbi:uncharacterized protein LOC26529021 [Drosophila willistoni]|nr:uncharacterized protein LOC26529021 [Drosophila willistoni]
MSVESTADSEYNFEDKFEKHLRVLFYMNPLPENPKCDTSKLEFFGVLRLKDVLKPERNLWCIYHCRQPDIDRTIDALLEKYGKKNMCEIFRKPIFKGAALRAAVKKYFTDLKWFVKGNLLEAPPKRHFNDDRVIKCLTDVYNIERQKLHNFVVMQLHWGNQYR